MANKIILKNVRISYANLFESRPANNNDPDSDLKYSAQIIMPEDHPQMEKLREVINEAGKEKFGAKFKPKSMKIPLRTKDEDDDDPVYDGMVFFNASSKRKPQVVDRAMDPLLDDSEIWSGCYVNISVAFFGFDVNGNRGVASGLNNVQLVKEGERLGGAANADDDFDAMDDDEFLMD